MEGEMDSIKTRWSTRYEKFKQPLITGRLWREHYCSSLQPATGKKGCRARPVPIGTTSTNFGTTSTKIDFLVLDAPVFFWKWNSQIQIRDK